MTPIYAVVSRPLPYSEILVSCNLPEIMYQCSLHAPVAAGYCLKNLDDYDLCIYTPKKTQTKIGDPHVKLYTQHIYPL